MANRIPSAFGGSRATPALWRRWLGLTTAVNGPAGATDGVPVLFDGATGRLIKATTFGAFKTALALAKADVGLGSVLNVPQREQLTAGRTYYVRTDGSNSNTGLADSSGGAFLTIQKAVDVVSAIDLSVHDVTIQVRDGTYAEALTLGPLVGSGKVTILGNTATPANVVIDPPSGFGVQVNANGWVLDSFRLHKASGTATGGLRADAAYVVIQNLDFGAGFTNAHITAEAVGYVHMFGANVVSASCARFVSAFRNGVFIKVGAATITLTGTPAFSTAFAAASYGAVVGLNGAATVTGAATGKRFDATLNGVINYASGVASLPGDVTGTTATGGQAV